MINSKEYISLLKSLQVVVVEKPKKPKDIVSFAKKYLPQNVYIPGRLAEDIVQLKEKGKIDFKSVKAIFKSLVKGLNKIGY